MNVSYIHARAASSINWASVLKTVAQMLVGFWFGLALAAIAHALLFVISILAGKTIATLVVLPLLLVACYLMPEAAFAALRPVDAAIDRFFAKR